MRAAIALGSNLPSRFGNPSDNLREAILRLEDLGQVTAVSSFFETDPVGYTNQPRFTNGAVLLTTALSPFDLLHCMLGVEEAMGRRRSADAPAKGPRVIDLDLLLYEDAQGNNLILNDPDLILPHPELHGRLFVLAPLAEIAPDFVHPRLKQTIRDLHNALLT